MDSATALRCDRCLRAEFWARKGARINHTDLVARSRPELRRRQATRVRSTSGDAPRGRAGECRNTQTPQPRSGQSMRSHESHKCSLG